MIVREREINVCLSLTLFLSRIKEEYSLYQKLWDLLDKREKVDKCNTKPFTTFGHLCKAVLRWEENIIMFLVFQTLYSSKIYGTKMYYKCVLYISTLLTLVEICIFNVFCTQKLKKGKNKKFTAKLYKCFIWSYGFILVLDLKPLILNSKTFSPKCWLKVLFAENC